MTDEYVATLLDDLYPRDAAPAPAWEDVLARSNANGIMAAAVPHARPGIGRLGARKVILAAAVLVAVAGGASAAVVALRPPRPLQNPKGCAAIWNRSAPLETRMNVARIQPISALVVGTGVLVIGGTPRCALLLMTSSGHWYATETPTDTAVKTWSPIKRLQDGIAMQYITSGKPISAMARLLPDGKLAVAK